MDDGLECRLLVGELIAKCMDVGLSRREVMQIVTGEPGEVSALLAEVHASDAIERRVRYLLEIVSIAKSICGAETGPWLRSENPALGQRSPLETMITFTDALPGMMHLMRRFDEGGGSVH
jgi:hypothetical protein